MKKDIRVLYQDRANLVANYCRTMEDFLSFYEKRFNQTKESKKMLDFLAFMKNNFEGKPVSSVDDIKKKQNELQKSILAQKEQIDDEAVPTRKLYDTLIEENQLVLTCMATIRQSLADFIAKNVLTMNSANVLKMANILCNEIEVSTEIKGVYGDCIEILESNICLSAPSETKKTKVIKNLVKKVEKKPEVARITTKEQ